MLPIYIYVKFQVGEIVIHRATNHNQLNETIVIFHHLIYQELGYSHKNR